MDAATEIPSFGPDATSAGQKNGDRAEAGPQKGNLMQTVTTTTNIPQSIASTVTVFDPKEQRRLDAETARAQAWLDERLSRGRSAIFTEDVAVTPVIAKLLLQRNPDNRSISNARISEIKADLINGDWVFNGETIIVSSDGYLNDGQHRLLACRDTGKTMRSMVVFGVPRKARLTTDQGSARTTAHYLAMGGDDENPKVVAAVGRLILQFDKVGTIKTNLGGNAKGKEGLMRVTKAQILGSVADNRDAIRRSVEHANKKGHKLLGAVSLVAFCHLLFSRIDQVAATNFIDRAIDGVNLGPTDPIYALRQRFMNDPHLTTPDRFEAIIRAWNAYRGDGHLTRIQLMGRVPRVSGLGA